MRTKFKKWAVDYLDESFDNQIKLDDFNKEDLDLLKAIAFEKNTTVNKILMSIIKEPLGVTRNNLPDSFDVTEKAAQYEVKSKKRNK